MSYPTTKCENCNKLITNNNYEKHIVSCGKTSYNRNIPITEKYKINDEYICPYCNLKFSKFGIGSHIWKRHTEAGINFTWTQTAWNKGLTKETDDRVKNNGESIRKLHKSNPELWPKRIHTVATKKLLSKLMTDRHKNGTAWNIGKSRWNNEPSYPEQFFSKVIVSHFEDIEYKTEYPIGNFSLDFAWPHKLKAIEIDGEQHYRFEDQIQRDIRKNKLCDESGWKLLRIRWIDMYNNPKKYIQIAKIFIDES